MNFGSVTSNVLYQYLTVKLVSVTMNQRLFTIVWYYLAAICTNNKSSDPYSWLRGLMLLSYLFIHMNLQLIVRDFNSVCIKCFFYQFIKPPPGRPVFLRGYPHPQSHDH